MFLLRRSQQHGVHDQGLAMPHPNASYNYLSQPKNSIRTGKLYLITIVKIIVF